MNIIKIMLVDDHSLVRDGINAMLSSYSDLEIIAEAESGQRDDQYGGYCEQDASEYVVCHGTKVHIFFPAD